MVLVFDCTTSMYVEMQLVIMSDRNQGLLSVVLRVFGIENHSYCLKHVRGNFLTYMGKLGIRRQALKDLLNEVFNRFTYAPAGIECGVAIEELRKYKPQLAAWVKCNESKRSQNSQRRGGVG